MKTKMFRFITVICSVFFILSLVACPGNGMETNVDSQNTGSISGKVIYTNLNESSNAGIIVTLEKTDGLRTIAVMRSAKARNIADNSRSIAANTITSSDGSYLFENLEEGTYTVYAASPYSSEKAVYTNVVVRSAEQTIAEVLQLIATGSISGTITLDDNSTGNTGFLVFVAGTSFMAMTDDAGNYKISDVPAGANYQVIATKDGVTHSLSSNVVVTANGSTTMADNNFSSSEFEKNIESLKGEKGDKGDNGDKGDDGAPGTNGISIKWLGSFDSSEEISEPEYLNAYFNKTDGCSYIYNGIEWTLLAKIGAKGEKGEPGDVGQNGTNGTNGTDGSDGLSIQWKGEFSIAPSNPGLYWAYYNTTTGCSYIWNGIAWNLLTNPGVNNSDALAIGTLFSTESSTNSDVIITVNVSHHSIEKIGYVYSADVPDFTDARVVLNSSDFISITKGFDNKYSISAAANGYYTIVVKDSDGYVAYVQEHITNIDKTAPAPVTALQSLYDKNTKIMTVTWTNPTDEDFDFVKLSYTKAGTVVVADEHITNTTYTINDVECDGAEYEFTLFAVDALGNTSTATKTSITPAREAGVQSITLSRYHLAYNDPDQTVVATVHLSNAYLFEDGTIVKIQTKDPDGNVTNTNATVDKTAGTATATINVPSLGSNLDSYGSTFTVLCKIGAENADTIHTARFNVSGVARLGELSMSYNDSYFTDERMQFALSTVTNSTTVIVRIIGYNLDLTTPSIQLYDSTGEAYFEQPVAVDTSTVQWTSINGSNYQIIDTQINVPTVEDIYNMKILFDGVLQSNYTRQLWVYDSPKFTSLSIPLVSISKENTIVTAEVIGENFDTPDVDLSNFTATCSSDSSIVANTSFTRNSDTSLNATFIIPGVIGDYDITVSYGEQSIQGVLKVFGIYSVGDVLLTDGTIIPYDENNFTFTDDQKQNAVGVLYAIDEYGIPRGYLGIFNSADGITDGKYLWRGEQSTGNYTYDQIICTPIYGPDTSWPETEPAVYAGTAIFRGDLDGSDNWTYICSIDPAGAANASVYYPAFNYANNYASTHNLTGNFATGWYMPSVAELCYIYINKDTLNLVLNALDGNQMQDVYWSSSRIESGIFPWWVSITYGTVHSYYGSPALEDSNRVCVIRAFSY
jgi:hypothetical protein